MAGVRPENACACGIFLGSAGYEILRLTVQKVQIASSLRLRPENQDSMLWQGGVALKQAACFRPIREK